MVTNGYRSLGLFLVFFLFFPFMVNSADSTEKNEGMYVLYADGPCQLHDANQKLIFEGDGNKLEGEEIPIGGKLETGNKAKAILLQYPDMTRITVAPNSDFQFKNNHSIWTTLGKVWVKISKPFFERSRFEVESPNAVAVAHGTAFEVAQGENGSDVHVFEGNVELNNGSKSIFLKPGQYVAGARHGQHLVPKAFSAVKGNNPWWNWNLRRETKFENFLQNHGKEFRQVLQSRTLGKQERLNQVRGFMKQHGLTRQHLTQSFHPVEHQHPLPSWQPRNPGNVRSRPRKNRQFFRK